MTPDRRRVARDLLSLLLVAAGATGIITTAFLTHVLLGWGVVSVLTLTVGVVTGVDRTDTGS